ncbi:hypothetical protein LTR66_006278 [Elasticomyces elasticus]|nr:hypothetical protein LTR66_006278 [Elasticomyces elasticus]
MRELGRSGRSAEAVKDERGAKTEVIKSNTPTYTGAASSTPTVMQHPAQEPQQGDNIEMSLREHLMRAQEHGPMQPPVSASPPASDAYHQSNSASPDHQHLDPSFGGHPYGMGGDSGADDLSPDSRKGKRELSTSKRAAQNRAAQRAFRQRKEGYIKKLEEQVKDTSTIEENYRILSNENYHLREYIMALQSALLDSSGEMPQPPPNIDLSRQHAPPLLLPSQAQPHELSQPANEQGHSPQQAPTASMASNVPPPNPDMLPSAIRQLRAAAAQAGELDTKHGLDETPYHTNKRLKVDNEGSDLTPIGGQQSSILYVHDTTGPTRSAAADGTSGP